MKKQVFFFILLFCINNFAATRTIFVSTTGNDSGPGTEAIPYLNIQKAIDVAEAGDIIYVRGGTYRLSQRIKIDKPGREDACISLFGYPGERVIIDGSQIVTVNVNEFKQARCIYVNHFGDYWHFKNLEMCNAKDNGMKLEGSFCIIENCKFYGNNDTGLQIGMYKDFSIEETRSLPISGEPTYNPGYTYSKYNKVINCDAWNNYDSKSFSGSDDGGDADGFAAKLFPGPGTEFHGCRAWNNSDDNWDLYMVYHPIVINNCWAWNGGKDQNGIARGNGNGFKLGGGGTSGGAAFAQSVGAHVVTNNVSFNNTNKGFDQNNAYEAMYLFNNVAWGSAYNYRFPTVIPYGTMYMRNNIGFRATTLNHEFLSANKEGSKVPDTDFNSWTTFDGCDPYKDGNKIGSTSIWAKDYTNQFKNLNIDLAMAERQIDGSLPENDFSRLIANSLFINAGENIENLVPQAHSPGGWTLSPVFILYNDGRADMGAFETGDPTTATLGLITGKEDQYVYAGTAIQQTVYKWGGAATDVLVENLPQELQAEKDMTAKKVIITGIPLGDGIYTVTNIGGTNHIIISAEIRVSQVAPATLQLISGKASQEVFHNNSMETQVFTWGGGASDVMYTTLPAGLHAEKDITAQTLTVSGIPIADGSYTISTVGGMEGSQVNINCNITRVLPNKVLTGGWYHIQDEYENLPLDLQGVVAIQNGTNSSYPTVWNPTYTESGSVPAGCTVGAINLERSGGAVSWTVPSLVELKSNIHFTGSRTLRIEWTIDNVTRTWISESLSKQTMVDWDMMLAIGLEPTPKPVTLKFINTSASGGIRMYDFYVKTYDIPSSVPEIEQLKILHRMYQTETTLIVYAEDIARLKIIDLRGAVVSQSFMSQIVNIAHLNSGVYMVQIEDVKGNTTVQKFIKR